MATALGWTKCRRLKLENVNSSAAEHGGVAAAQPPLEQQPRAEHHQRIGEQVFQSQGGVQRQESVQELVQRMVDAGLALAGQIETGDTAAASSRRVAPRASWSA